MKRSFYPNTVRVAVAKYVVEVKHEGKAVDKVYFDTRDQAIEYAEDVAETNKAKLITYDLKVKTEQK